MGFNLFLRVAMCLGIMLCMMTTVHPQRVVINGSGERIIMYPDGTWRKAEAGDSLLLKQYANPQKVGTPLNDDLKNPQKRNKGEEFDFLLRQWNGLYADLIAEEKEVQNVFRAATNAQFKANEELKNAEANKQLMEPDRLASLHEQYDLSVSNLRAAKLQQKDIKSLVDKGRKINEKPESISQSKINRIKTSFTIYLSRHHRSSNSIPADDKPAATIPVANPTPEALTAEPNSPSGKAIEEPVDPSMMDKRPNGIKPTQYHDVPFPCDFDTDTIDKATGRNRRELHPAILFTHTDPDLRPYFKNKDLITCRARLTKIGPYDYLSVEFQIASSHSQSNFGTLAEGSLLRFRLMDGEYVSLYNLKAHNGRIDPYSGYTIFAGQYALGKTELKKLSDSELDKMRVLWSTGYEDYEIYHIDLLINQINCLEAKD